MPIYEYRCEKCGREFETLVMGSNGEKDVCCPGCQSNKVSRQMSGFSCSGGEGGGLSLPSMGGGAGGCGGGGGFT